MEDTITYKSMEIEESDVLRYIVEYENTQLLENETIKRLESLEESPDILYSEKERSELLRKLTEIQDRYRINPFVIEKNGKFKLKYGYDGEKVVYDMKENPIDKLSNVPRLDIQIPLDIDENEVEITHQSDIPKIDMILKEEKSTKSNVSISAKIKISPPNPRRIYKNTEYNNGVYPLMKGLWFKIITAIPYKNYKSKGGKRFISLIERDKQKIIDKEYYRFADIIPIRDNKIYYQEKINPKTIKLKKMVSLISKSFDLHTDSMYKNSCNIMRIIKNV